MGEAQKETLFLSPVTETKINKIIKALKDFATGHDDISAQFLKLSLNFMMHACNVSPTEGVFPDSLSTNMTFIDIDSGKKQVNFYGITISSR